MITLDHIAISGKTLDEASDHVESSLGVKLQDGGCHDRYGTHNKLLSLANGIYLEAIAINPQVVKPRYPRWFNLDNFNGKPRITNWICRSENIYSDTKNIFFESTEIIKMKRNQLQWLMTVPRNGILPFDGAFPAILQWETIPPIANLVPSGCDLRHMTIFHPKALTLQNKIKSINDPRISFEPNNKVAFFAEFDTPHGIRSIE